MGYNKFMIKNPVKAVLVFGFILLGSANIFVSVLTFAVKSQKYGLADLWQNPDGFAFGTGLIGLTCLGVAYWFYRRS